jgi:hypothetical protein
VFLNLPFVKHNQPIKHNRFNKTQKNKTIADGGK